MSSKQHDARNEVTWNWDEDTEAEDSDDDELVFQPHHCDPSDYFTD